MALQMVRQLLSRGYVGHRQFLLGAHSAPIMNHSTQAPSDNTIDFTTASSDEPISIENPFEREKKVCILCKMNVHPNYKNVRLLSQFQSPYTGRIYGRHITGLCKEQQERVEREITRSQRAGYMGSYNKAVEFLQDPKLFDPERPLRPHNY